ncbi:MAG: hypothetical protein ACPGQM_01165 [Alphaproteobacteria bacterium]
MSLNTLVAVLVGFGLFIAAIALSTNNYCVFLSSAGAILVLGGTVASTFIIYEYTYVFDGLRGIVRAFRIYRRGRSHLNAEVGRVIRLAYLVHKEGIVSLDAEAKKTPGWDVGFLGFGVELLTSEYEGAKVQSILGNVIESTYERNMVGAQVLRSMATAAPAAAKL